MEILVTSYKDLPDPSDEGANLFVEKLRDFIKKMLIVLPSNVKLMGVSGLYDTLTASLEMRKLAVKRWHYEMTRDSDGSLRNPSIYQHTLFHNASMVLEAKIDLMDMIGAKEIYSDLNDENRNIMFVWLIKINELAQRAFGLEPEVKQTREETKEEGEDDIEDEDAEALRSTTKFVKAIPFVGQIVPEDLIKDAFAMVKKSPARGEGDMPISAQDMSTLLAKHMNSFKDVSEKNLDGAMHFMKSLMGGKDSV